MPSDHSVGSQNPLSNVNNVLPSQNVSQQGLTTTSQASSTSGQFPSASDEEKRRYHQQLVLLLHAYKCQKRDSANGEVRRECNLTQCQGMQNVIIHIQVCQAGNACPVPNCASSKALILHWKNCTQRECALCVPLRQCHNPIPNQAVVQRAYSSSGLPFPSNNSGVMPSDQNAGSQNPLGTVDNLLPGQNVSQQGLTTTSQTSSASDQFSSASDEEKRRYHQQLVMLLHAYKCQKLDFANREVRGECNLTRCRETQNVIIHIQVCQSGNDCPVPNCASSKALILHWKNCTQRECVLCLPLRQAHRCRQQEPIQTSQENPVPNQAAVQRADSSSGPSISS